MSILRPVIFIFHGATCCAPHIRKASIHLTLQQKYANILKCVAGHFDFYKEKTKLQNTSLLKHAEVFHLRSCLLVLPITESSKSVQYVKCMLKGDKKPHVLISNYWESIFPKSKAVAYMQIGN